MVYKLKNLGYVLLVVICSCNRKEYLLKNPEIEIDEKEYVISESPWALNIINDSVCALAFSNNDILLYDYVNGTKVSNIIYKEKACTDSLMLLTASLWQSMYPGYRILIKDDLNKSAGANLDPVRVENIFTDHKEKCLYAYLSYAIGFISTAGDSLNMAYLPCIAKINLDQNYQTSQVQFFPLNGATKNGLVNCAGYDFFFADGHAMYCANLPERPDENSVLKFLLKDKLYNYSGPVNVFPRDDKNLFSQLSVYQSPAGIFMCNQKTITNINTGYELPYNLVNEKGLIDKFAMPPEIPNTILFGYRQPDEHKKNYNSYHLCLFDTLKRKPTQKIQIRDINAAIKISILGTKVLVFIKDKNGTYFQTYDSTQ
jgi:hypothetical protein